MLINQNDSLEQIWEMIQLELKKGVSAKRHPFKFAVLSSSNQNRVASRWVVFRKYTIEGSILIYTDIRSEKYKELEINPKCSLLFYHDRHKLQVRIEANAILNHRNELTQTYWPGVKGSNPNDYLTIRKPGDRIQNKELGHERDSNIDDQYFAIIELFPDRFDVLQLNGDRHIRAEFVKKEDSWDSSFLVP